MIEKAATRLLLDTHALLWLVSGNPRLSRQARAVIDDRRSTVLVSVVSLWEIVLKVRLGKLPREAANVGSAASLGTFDVLQITREHLETLATLPIAPGHRDPFDHMLIAQAIAEEAVLVTDDRHAGRYPATVIPCG